MKKRAIISLSGGLDSTCLLMKLINDGYEEIYCYSFFYGQKHSIELKKVKKNIKFLQEKGYPLTHQIIDLSDCFDNSASSLHQGNEDIPEGNYKDENMKSTVVENRNVIFAAIIYGKAIAISKKFDCDVDIALGIHAGDHSIYPDCRPESHAACAHAFEISNWGSERVKYIAPFENIDKGKVLEEGLFAMEDMQLKHSEQMKILKNTHTCYNPNDKGESCGKCGSCNERLEAFKYVGIKDPIKYQNN